MDYFLYFIKLSLPISHCKKIQENAHDDFELYVKGDAWFGSVKAAASLADKGIETVLQVKNNSALYPKAFIEEKLKECPGGVHIVLKGRHPNGHNLVAIGYRYSSKKTLFFIMTEGAGSTTPGKPYQMKFTDEYGNVGKF